MPAYFRLLSGRWPPFQTPAPGPWGDGRRDPAKIPARAPGFVNSIGVSRTLVLGTPVSRQNGMMLPPSDLSRSLMRYCEPSTRHALFEVAVTLIPLLLLWVAMWLSLDVGYWLTLLLAVPAAGFMVRLFIIQHDCGHGAFFRHRAVNDWVGRLLGVLTLTPYDYWKRNHAVHHATSSNLDRRGIGDIELLTVEEYQGRSWWQRFAYRCYRSPPVMFVIGPAYMFFLQHRLPFHQMRGGWRPWISTMATNAAIVLAV